MTKISIFELEKRFDLEKEFEKISNDLILRENIWLTNGMYETYKYISFEKLINNSILRFPGNKSSRSLNEYFLEYRIDDMPLKEGILMKVDFFINYILWMKDSDDFTFSDDSFAKGIIPILNNCKYIIEELNYTLIKDKNAKYNYPQYIIVKRDYDVDSVLSQFSSDLRVQLLTYLDFRNENDLRYKESVIYNLYKDLESREDELKVQQNDKLYNDTKFALNYPRHHRDSSLNEKKRIELCDKAFYMYIHLIRSKLIRQYQEDIKVLKS